MNLRDEWRERVAEVLLRKFQTPETEWAKRDLMSDALKDADALLAPGGVVAGIVAEVLRSPYDEDGYCEFCGNHCGKAHSPTCAWADLRDAREEGAAEVRARVEALCNAAERHADTYKRACIVTTGQVRDALTTPQNPPSGGRTGPGEGAGTSDGAAGVERGEG